MTTHERRTANLVQHDQQSQLAASALEALQQALGDHPGLASDGLLGQAQADDFGSGVHADDRVVIVHVDHAHVVDGLVERRGAVAYAVAAKGADAFAQHA